MEYSLGKCDVVVSIHGCCDSKQVVYMGGLDCTLKEEMCRRLKDSGFKAKKHADPKFQGEHLKNICNRGRSDRGVQLELSKGLRVALEKDNHRIGAPLLSKFVTAIRGAIDHNTST